MSTGYIVEVESQPIKWQSFMETQTLRNAKTEEKIISETFELETLKRFIIIKQGGYVMILNVEDL